MNPILLLINPVPEEKKIRIMILLILQLL